MQEIHQEEKVKEEFQKAYEDMIIFGTGIMKEIDGELKHVPFMETNKEGEVNDN